MLSKPKLFLSLLLVPVVLRAEEPKDLSQQIIDLMIQAAGNHPGYRPVHAKGIVCEGTFTASKEAPEISRAAHLAGGAIPLTIRFSDGAPDPAVADNSPQASPRGIAIRFKTPTGKATDIVAISHNGFVVATGAEFLAFTKSQVETDPSKPHPWPVEAFLGSHPAALKFVKDLNTTPVSLATEAFFGNNAFIFVNKAGVKQAGRYQILPVGGAQYLDAASAKAKVPDFLSEELKTRLADGPAKFRLVLQLAGPGDTTSDSTVVWPADRKTVELGVISITSVAPNSASVEKALAFDPTRLTDGIELSDDPLPALRSRVYALSVAHRNSH